MKVINFLPEDYQQRRGARRANLFCAAIGVGALVVLGGLTTFMAVRAAAISRTRKAADQQYADASRQITQMKDLEDRKAGLLHKVEVSSSLLERVPRSTLLAHLTNHLPPHTSLSNLTMRAVEVEEPNPAAEAAKGAPAPAAQDAAKKPPATIKVRRIEFVLTGLAQTDVDVAKYIGLLCADPLFQEIDLKFSEEFPYKETIRMRRFEIALLLSPKAGELLERAPAPKTVAAAPSDPGPLARGEP